MKKKKKIILDIAIVILIAVIIFCLINIIHSKIDDKIAQKANEDLYNQFVEVMDPDDIQETTELLSPDTELTAFIADTSADETSEFINTTADMGDDTTEPEIVTTPEDTSEPEESSDIAEPVTNEDTVIITTPSTTAVVTTVAETKAPEPPNMGENLKINFTGLLKTNSDIKGWLYGMGGIVNYPVLQGQDNDKYLTYLYNGKKSNNGSLFIHYRNTLYEDDFFLLYGHAMASGAMFGRLWWYQDYSYYEKFPFFMYYTPDAVYRLEVCMYLKTDTSEEYRLVCRNEKEFNDMIAMYEAKAVYRTDVDINYGDHIFILSTCRGYSTGRRDLRANLFCKMVKVR